MYQPSKCKELSIISIFTERKWQLAVCALHFKRGLEAVFVGRMQEELSLCTVRTVYVSWASHPCFRSVGCFHVNHILARSQNPILPLGSYNHVSFWMSPEVICLRGRYTGLTEHSAKGTKRVEFTSLPQWEWHRVREHMNSVAAVVQCCTHTAKDVQEHKWVTFVLLMYTTGHVSVCIQNYVLKYLKHLHKALGRTELNQI